MVMVVSGRPLMVLKRQTADGDGDGGDGDGGDGDGGDGDGDGDDDDVDVISTFSSIWHGISWLCGEQVFQISGYPAFRVAGDGKTPN